MAYKNTISFLRANNNKAVGFGALIEKAIKVTVL